MLPDDPIVIHSVVMPQEVDEVGRKSDPGLMWPVSAAVCI